MARQKDVLTTGEVAKVCKVAPRTVSKWFDSGKLRGYRIPGSKDRRIPVQQLVRFMQAHGIPLNGLESGLSRILIAESDPELAESFSQALSRDGAYEVRVARSTFEAGLLAGVARPHVLFLDVDLPGLAHRETLRIIRNHPDLALTRIVAVTPYVDEGQRQTLLQHGFDQVMSRPLQLTEVVQVIEALLSSSR